LADVRQTQAGVLAERSTSSQITIDHRHTCCGEPSSAFPTHAWTHTAAGKASLNKALRETHLSRKTFWKIETDPERNTVAPIYGKRDRHGRSYITNYELGSSKRYTYIDKKGMPHTAQFDTATMRRLGAYHKAISSADIKKAREIAKEPFYDASGTAHRPTTNYNVFRRAYDENDLDESPFMGQAGLLILQPQM
jgi:hypothetical protein